MCNKFAFSEHNKILLTLLGEKKLHQKIQLKHKHRNNSNRNHHTENDGKIKENIPMITWPKKRTGGKWLLLLRGENNAHLWKLRKGTDLINWRPGSFLAGSLARVRGGIKTNIPLFVQGGDNNKYSKTPIQTKNNENQQYFQLERVTNPRGILGLIKRPQKGVQADLPSPACPLPQQDPPPSPMCQPMCPRQAPPHPSGWRKTKMSPGFPLSKPRPPPNPNPPETFLSPSGKGDSTALVIPQDSRLRSTDSGEDLTHQGERGRASF